MCILTRQTSSTADLFCSVPQLGHSKRMQKSVIGQYRNTEAAALSLTKHASITRIQHHVPMQAGQQKRLKASPPPTCIQNQLTNEIQWTISTFTRERVTWIPALQSSCARWASLVDGWNVKSKSRDRCRKSIWVVPNTAFPTQYNAE